MARVTVTEVRVVLPASTQLTDEQIQAAIDAASCLIGQAALSCASHLSEDCLKTVELYLTSHFAAATENTLSISSETDACCGGQVMYGFKFGSGILGTPFGQMANTLTGGCLAQMDKAKPSMHVIGCI